MLLLVSRDDDHESRAKDVEGASNFGASPLADERFAIALTIFVDYETYGKLPWLGAKPQSVQVIRKSGNDANVCFATARNYSISASV